MNSRCVAIFDPNSLNPYGYELARCLSVGGYRVSLRAGCLPEGANSTRVGSLTMRYMAFDRPRRKRDLLTWFVIRILAPLSFSATTLLRNRSAIVVWVRDDWQALVLSALSFFRPLYLIDHNPVGRRSEPRKSLFVRILEARATSRPVHASALAHGRPVVIHPSYSGLIESLDARKALTGRPPWPGDAVRRLVFIGSLRPDKGAALLPAIVESLNGSALLVMAGASKDQLQQSALRPLMESGRVECVPGPLSDEALVKVLRSSDLVLAPYVEPTQSGSLVMAMTAGVEAVAFNGGALGGLLAKRRLASALDVEDLVRKIEEAFHDKDSGWLVSRNGLDAGCEESWRAILDSYS